MTLNRWNGQKKRFIFSCLCAFIFGYYIVLIGIFLDKVSEISHMNTSQTSFYLSLNYAGYMSLIFVGGLLAEKIGSKKMLQIVLIGSIVAAFFFYSADSSWQFFLFSFLGGGIYGILESIAYAMAGDIDKTNSELYVYRASMILTLGYCFGAVAAGFFVKADLYWKGVYLVGASVCFLALFFSFFITDNRKKDALHQKVKTEQKINWSLLVKSGGLMGCLAMLLYGGIEAATFSWLTSYFVKDMKIDYSNSIFIMCLYYLTLLIGKLIQNRLAGRFRAVDIAIVCSLASFVSLCFMIFIHNFIIICVFAAILGLSMSTIAPFIIGYAGARIGGPTGYSLVIGSAGIGTVVIPGFIGVMQNIMDMGMAIMIFSPIYLILAGMFIKVFRKNVMEDKLDHVEIDS